MNRRGRRREEKVEEGEGGTDVNSSQQMEEHAVHVHTNLWSASCWVLCMLLPASRMMILRLLHIFRVGLCVLTYHVHKNYLMYIVAM